MRSRAKSKIFSGGFIKLACFVLLVAIGLFFSLRAIAPTEIESARRHTFQQTQLITVAEAQERAVLAQADGDPGAGAPTPDAGAGQTPSGQSGTFGVGIAIPGHGGNFSGFSDWIKAFYEFSIRLGAILTILMLVYAGYRYMTSQGNPSAINEAKDILIGSLSGYAMLLLVNLIINFIGTRN